MEQWPGASSSPYRYPSYASSTPLPNVLLGGGKGSLQPRRRPFHANLADGGSSKTRRAPRNFSSPSAQSRSTPHAPQIRRAPTTRWGLDVPSLFRGGDSHAAA